MLKNDKEVETLINNISMSLAVLSVPDLNKAVLEALNRQNKEKKDYSFEISVLIKIICAEFSIHKTALYEKYCSGEVYNSKVVLYVIMNQNLGMSKRSISIMFNNFPNAITQAIKFWENLNLKRPSHEEIMNKYKRCLTLFLEKIN